MDLAQAARMIEWLDEERRRDRGIIASLEERLVQQDEMVAHRSTMGTENQLHLISYV